jgi:hypothetical protein
VAAFGQAEGVAPAAARNVDDPRSGWERQLALDEVDLGLGGLRRHRSPPELVG